MRKIFFIILLGLMCLFPFSVSATGLGDAANNLGSVTKDTGLSGDFTTTLGAVIKGALSLVGTVFLVLMVYAGILWMTASGKEEQIEKASKIIKASIIGLFITMSAYAITYFASSKLGASSGGTSEYCTKGGSGSPAESECKKHTTKTTCIGAKCGWSTPAPTP